jgi:hypothetical protein
MTIWVIMVKRAISIKSQEKDKAQKVRVLMASTRVTFLGSFLESFEDCS